jgi:hypothetical protein
MKITNRPFSYCRDIATNGDRSLKLGFRQIDRGRNGMGQFHRYHQEVWYEPIR